jgi:hypothetical protein
MARIIEFEPTFDPIDKDVPPDVLDFANRRSKEVSSGFYDGLDFRIRAKNTDNVLALDGLRYVIKRAVIEGILWERNRID